MPSENKYVRLHGGRVIVRLLGTEIRSARREPESCAGLAGGCEHCARTSERKQMLAARKRARA